MTGGAWTRTGLWVATAATLAGCPKNPPAPAETPSAAVEPVVPAETSDLTDLEEAGRHIYLREGCDVCHIEPQVESSAPSNQVIDAAPSLRLLGGKYPDAWHYEHFRDPRSVVPGSVMPPYPFLIDERVDASSEAARQQGLVIAERLREYGVDEVSWDQEVVALIAFLQTLGLEESAALAAERKAAAAAEAKEWAASLDPTDPETLAAGKAIYDTNCVACHGPDMLGGIGPNLVDEETIHGGSLQEIFAVTRDGVPAKGMLTWGPILGDEKVGQVSAYVFSRAQANQASP